MPPILLQSDIWAKIYDPNTETYAESNPILTLSREIPI